MRAQQGGPAGISPIGPCYSACMHKDIKARVRAVATGAGLSYNDMRDALVVMGLLLYYSAQDGSDIKMIAPEKVLHGALDRAQRGNVVDKEPAKQTADEEAAWLLARQIERETGSE